MKPFQGTQYQVKLVNFTKVNTSPPGAKKDFDYTHFLFPMFRIHKFFSPFQQDQLHKTEGIIPAKKQLGGVQ
jgi:hypothetical protein